jgi:hypothetical protein
MTKNVIAIVSDWDGSLCPDTATLLVKDLGLDPAPFWPEVANDVEGAGTRHFLGSTPW